MIKIKQIKKLAFLALGIALLFFSSKISSKNTEIKPFSNLSKEEKILNQVNNIKQFIGKNSKYNQEIAFLIDMEIRSGKNRFFIYDLKNNIILDQGLVAHGLGSGNEIRGPLKFSNIPSSFCTSLGKYWIGQSYLGQFGKAYKLYGLDETNNNAFSRSIVLHKYDKVPYDEQDQPICQSLGCPMVNETYYKRIEKQIDHSKSRIILDIYY
jgi:hypothetical protein